MQALEVYNELVKKATEITETVDTEQGIDLIERDNVVIMVKPALFDKLAQAKLTGNGVLEAFELGQYGISSIAGYKIYANPFLKTIWRNCFSRFYWFWCNVTNCNVIW
ncbi:hypothetical protein NWQ33_00450 [Mycoplasmopsis cynos]|nr:hypothetical protein [Mycoplasmopsis cynos]